MSLSFLSTVYGPENQDCKLDPGEQIFYASWDVRNTGTLTLMEALPERFHLTWEQTFYDNISFFIGFATNFHGLSGTHAKDAHKMN